MPLIRRAVPEGIWRVLGGVAATMLCALLLGPGGLLAPSAEAATGEFEVLASSSVPLTSVAVDPTTNIVYAQENYGEDFFSYDPRTDKWTELEKAPINSGNNGGATYLDGKIYTSYTGNPSEMGVYDISSNSWSTIENPLGNGTANIVAAGEDLYMAAGGSFIEYNPATEKATSLAGATFPECYGSTDFEPWGGLQLFQGKIYGHQGDGCTGFGVYDIATNSWSELPEVPGGAVAGSAIDPVSGTYFAYGTYEEDNLYSYDIASQKWTTTTLPLGEVGDGGMAYVGLPGLQGIYIIEGEDGTGFIRLITGLEADLSLGMSAGTATATVGDEVTYTIDIANGGPSYSAGTVVTDQLPSSLSLLSATVTQGSCKVTAPVTCDIGAVPNGGAVTVTIKAKAASAGTATNTATVESEALDPNHANDSASATIAIAGLTSTTTTTTSTSTTTTATRGCVVPKMHGLRLKRLKKALRAGDCALGKVTRRYNRKVKKGLVILGKPHHGKTLAAGSKIDIWLSRGHYHHKKKKHKARKQHH